MGVHFSAHIADGLTTDIRPPTPRTRPPVADSSESSSSPPMWGDAGPVQGAGTVSSSPHHTHTSKTGISDAYGYFSSDRVAYIPISSDSTISTASAGPLRRDYIALLKSNTPAVPPSRTAALHDDPLAVRGIDLCMDPGRLAVECQLEPTPLGPVWAALLDDGVTVSRNGRKVVNQVPVRVFCLRAVTNTERAAKRLAAALREVLSEQVLFSHPALARPMGAVIDFHGDGDDGGRWIGLVYRFTVVAPLDPVTALHTVARGARFLAAMRSTEPMRLGLVHPALFLNGGSEVACWGLVGAVRGLWVDSSCTFVSPALAGRDGAAVRASEAAEVFALGVWAVTLFFGGGSGPAPKHHAHLREHVTGCRDGERTLTAAIYGILAELENPDCGWAWFHYACQGDDVAALERYLSDGGDPNQATLRWQLTPLAVACLHGSTGCIRTLISAGAETANAMVRAIEGGSLAAVDLLLQAGASIEADTFRKVNVVDPAYFDSLLDRYDGRLDGVLVALLSASLSPSPSCLALLGRRGVSLELPVHAAGGAMSDILGRARSLVPPGAHPLDLVALPNGGGETSDTGPRTAQTASGTANFGPAGWVYEGTVVPIPQWVSVFKRREFCSSRAIGAGAFGAVYKADLHGTAVAVKVVVLEDTDSLPSRHANVKKTRILDFVAEVAAHAQLRHPRTLLMLGLMVDDFTGDVAIVTELMDGGDLGQKLRAERAAMKRATGPESGSGGGFHIGLRARALRQAAEGIAYLHSQRLIHRDIKPGNVLLTASGDAKIGDFGLTSVVGGREGLTPEYAAPELLSQSSKEPASMATDAYAFALTAYTTLTLARLPRHDGRINRESEAPWQIDDCLPVPDGWWAELCVSGLGVDPDRRPQVDEWNVPLLAIERTRALDGGAFFGMCAVGWWKEALAVDEAHDGSVVGEHMTALHFAAAHGTGWIDVIAACVKRGCDVNGVNGQGLTPLMVAQSAGAIKALVGCGASLDVRNAAGFTALMFATIQGRLECVNILARVGAGVNDSFSNGVTVLMLAAQGGHAAVAGALIEAGADVNAAAANGQTALMFAVMEGHDVVVNLCLRAGADPNAVTVDGRTALICAAELGFSALVRCLLDAGASPNAGWQGGWTALMVAALTGRYAIVDDLLGAGADVTARTYTGETALMAAARQRRADVVEVLLQAGASPSDCQVDGRTALMRAVAGGHIDVVKCLCMAGADVNAMSADGRTALIIAAGSNAHAKVVRALVVLGADINHAGPDGVTALMTAATNGATASMAVLLEAGARVDARTVNGITALLAAVAYGFGECVDLLIDAGADVSATAYNGRTCLSLAIEGGHKAIADRLGDAMSKGAGAGPS